MIFSVIQKLNYLFVFTLVQETLRELLWPYCRDTGASNGKELLQPEVYRVSPAFSFLWKGSPLSKFFHQAFAAHVLLQFRPDLLGKNKQIHELSSVYTFNQGSDCHLDCVLEFYFLKNA